MKRIFTYLSFAVVLVFSSFTPVSFQAGTQPIVSALKAGNVTELSGYFDEFIDMKLPEKDEVKNMSRNQASIMLKSFFSDNSIKGFELTSEREIANNSYLAGKLTNNGKGYNITVMMKNKDGKYQIITVRVN